MMKLGEPVVRISLFTAMTVPTFWLLVATFFVCGYTTGGLILTHFVSWSTATGFSHMTAAKALGLMGGMNMLGTIASGWLCDHFGRKIPLAAYYLFRGVSLFLLIFVESTLSLYAFAILFGLNYISTVPPTTTITANVFGARSVGELSGWIFFSHQIGAALGATVGGWFFDGTGSYNMAFFSAGVLAVAASGLTLLIQDRPLAKTRTATAVA
jgi:predicted MFS family arabinose efflux permease